MAKHRIRRWLQFGILDLLLLTSVVAVVAALCRPLTAQPVKAPPTVLGIWFGGGQRVELMPDGYYSHEPASPPVEGIGWRLIRHTTIPDAFVLTYGGRQLIIRSEWRSGVMELLNESGTVRARLTQFSQGEGRWCNGTPDGTWSFVRTKDPTSVIERFEYKQGKLVDYHDGGGNRIYSRLNDLRRATGLQPLNGFDFEDEILLMKARAWEIQ